MAKGRTKVYKKAMPGLLSAAATDLKRFAKSHWVHILISPVMAALTFTVVHESAHAAVIILQGGTLLEFNFIPGGGKWGHVSYQFPAGRAYSDFAISIAPYLLWLAIAALACALSARRRPFPRWAAGTIFLWLFAAPLADIANAAFPYLLGADNDLYRAFGPPTASAWLAVFAGTCGAVLVGFYLQKQLYRGEGLSWSAYALLVAAALAGLCIITGVI